MNDDALFDTYHGGAVLSPDGHYRYTLERVWDAARPRLTFVMLNPSTADASEDDPTIRRCRRFGVDLGYGGVRVVNLYAYRATEPHDLFAADDPIGPDNDYHLTVAFQQAWEDDVPVVAAWGTIAPAERVERVMQMVGGVQHLWALHVTKDGHPGHPLYLPAAARPQPWPVS